MHFTCDSDKDRDVTGHYSNSRSRLISLPGSVWPSVHGSARHCPRYDCYYRSFGLWPALGWRRRYEDVVDDDGIMEVRRRRGHTKTGQMRTTENDNDNIGRLTTDVIHCGATTFVVVDDSRPWRRPRCASSSTNDVVTRRRDVDVAIALATAD